MTSGCENFLAIPTKINTGNHLKALSNFLDSYSSTYKKVPSLDDFNVEVDE